MRGHEEASGTKYVPEKLMEEWALKDPLNNYRDHLKEIGVLSEELIEQYTEEIKKEIDDNLKLAFDEEVIVSSESEELNDVYQDFDYKHFEESKEVENIRFIDALAQGLKQSMQQHKDLVLMGQDIADYGGVFKITENSLADFGKERVRNTPICESGIVAAAMGLSIKGIKSMVEMQFADFASTGFNPIVNYLAKVHYRWNQQADVVIRMPCGAGVQAGPFHSQTNEAWFTKTPGLKVVYPAFPKDAKGLLNTAFNDPNPVMFFEHKALYRSIRQEVPTNYYTIPFGKAAFLQEGNEVSIVTYGAAVHWAMEALLEFPDLSVDLIDLRTLQPLDIETVFNSVKKTGRVLIINEDSIFGSIASDIAAQIAEECFEYLDAPIKRLGSMETPIPFTQNLESQYLPKNRINDKLKELMVY